MIESMFCQTYGFLKSNVNVNEMFNMKNVAGRNFWKLLNFHQPKMSYINNPFSFFWQQKCAVVIWYFCWIRRQIGFSRRQFFFFNMPLPLVFLVVCSKQINQCTPMLASIIFLSELNQTEVHWARVKVLHSQVNVLYSLVLKSVCSWILCVYQDYK